MCLEISNNKEPNGSANNMYCWKDEMDQKAYQTFIIESENKRFVFSLLVNSVIPYLLENV
jgi:hypothetical protein